MILLEKNKSKEVIISNSSIKEVLMGILQIKKLSQKKVQSYRKEWRTPERIFEEF